MDVKFHVNSLFTHYDRNFIKETYALKQENGLDRIEKRPMEEGTEDTVYLSIPHAGTEYYYNCLANDYMSGAITEDEFYGHLEDLFASKGGLADDIVPYEERQSLFDSIFIQAHGAILGYYLRFNADEWSAIHNNPQCTDFYYNTDYHYQHLEQREKFIQFANVIAEKYGMRDMSQTLNQQICTVNGRMSVILGNNAGKFVTLDEPPPPGMKIILSTSYYPYEAKVICDGKTYSAQIPFDYDKLHHTFSLADLLSKYDIPARFMDFIKNINVINRVIIRDDPSILHFKATPGIFDQIQQYEKIDMYYNEYFKDKL